MTLEQLEKLALAKYLPGPAETGFEFVSDQDARDAIEITFKAIKTAVAQAGLNADELDHFATVADMRSHWAGSIPPVGYAAIIGRAPAAYEIWYWRETATATAQTVATIPTGTASWQILTWQGSGWAPGPSRAPQDGEVLVFRAASGRWEAGAPLPPATQFRGAVADSAALSSITNPQPGDLAVTRDDGHLHVYLASGWDDIGPAVAQPVFDHLDQMQDVQIAGTQNDGDILSWDSNLGKWVTAENELGAESNVTISGTAKNGVPVYDDANNTFEVRGMSVNDLTEYAGILPNDGETLLWDQANAQWILDIPTGRTGPAGPVGPPPRLIPGGFDPANPPAGVVGDIRIADRPGALSGATLNPGDLLYHSGTAWQIVGNLRGPIGPQGPVGSGLSVHQPVADQAARLALPTVEGTLVLQADTGEMWAYTGGAWARAGHLVGPAGPPGPTGSSAFPIQVLTRAAYNALGAAVSPTTIYVVTTT
jgi:hypothetical protein